MLRAGEKLELVGEERALLGERLEALGVPFYIALPQAQRPHVASSCEAPLPSLAHDVRVATPSPGRATAPPTPRDCRQEPVGTPLACGTCAAGSMSASELSGPSTCGHAPDTANRTVASCVSQALLDLASVALCTWQPPEEPRSDGTVPRYTGSRARFTPAAKAALAAAVSKHRGVATAKKSGIHWAAIRAAVLKGEYPELLPHCRTEGSKTLEKHWRVAPACLRSARCADTTIYHTHMSRYQNAGQSDHRNKARRWR
jgi:hypothetical protein